MKSYAEMEVFALYKVLKRKDICKCEYFYLNMLMQRDQSNLCLCTCIFVCIKKKCHFASSITDQLTSYALATTIGHTVNGHYISTWGKFTLHISEKKFPHRTSLPAYIS